MKRRHPMPFGGECSADGVRFRLWAPKARRVDVLLARRTLAMQEMKDGWFELVTPEASPGTRYKFRIGGAIEVPDPASRFQPDDVHGPSQVVDPTAFQWRDGDWLGRPWEEAVIYELHVGTFTAEGTFAGVESRLRYLKELGVTAIELMPVSDFPGARNWGYDGVLPYAPDACYGTPDDLKRLIQAAHALGLMVFLDVVYNHFGPDGNYLRSYAPEFFTARHRTPWGEAINYDGPSSRAVRDFFIHNALYWLEEYHLDGLRFDAVHAIVDHSHPHILVELAETVRHRIAPGRHVHLVLENMHNAAHYLPHDNKNHAQWYNAQWNDDIHHAVHVLTTGESDGYYSDYAKTSLQFLGRCLTEGFAYQGELSEYQGNVPRGEPSSELPPAAFVSFLQNHDQIGNRALGERITQLAGTAAVKAAMSILLLAPSPPLLFMGEEFGARTPFFFFCDFSGDLAAAVTEGRRSEFSTFAQFKSAEARARIPDPNSVESYARSKLDWSGLNNSEQRACLHFYRELLGLRQNTIVPLLRAGNPESKQFKTFEGTGLLAEWHFSGSVILRLLANMGVGKINSGATLASEHPANQILYSSSNEATEAQTVGQLPPWSVIWTLQS